MNNFTKGEWLTKRASNCGDGLLLIREGAEQTHLQVNPAADAHLIATAGTAATKLAEAGYDAVKVLEMLPQLVRALDEFEIPKHKDYVVVGRGNGVEYILEQCRGDV